MNTLSVKIDIPADANLIFGQSHFIKTVEDLYETLIGSGTALKFGLAKRSITMVGMLVHPVT